MALTKVVLSGPNTWRKCKEAGNERCVYVFRENDKGTPINLNELRGLTLETGEKLVIHEYG
jgi:hypothetical protein